ncbi:hypothetical protein ACSLVN_28125, partial [Klebsiella pneumoniae]|uniref:hypothetical protein n=1 Tax=Klebsiella pneumoniae TaxID=573 RepID=UPI003EE2C101
LAPTDDFEAAHRRSHLVLHSLRRQGWITAEEEAAAIARPPLLAKEPEAEGDFGYILDAAAAEARALNVAGV